MDPTDFLRSTVQHSTVPYGGANTLAPHIITREKFALENYRRCLYIAITGGAAGRVARFARAPNDRHRFGDAPILGAG